MVGKTKGDEKKCSKEQLIMIVEKLYKFGKWQIPNVNEEGTEEV
jgi:hypothetical protein